MRHVVAEISSQNRICVGPSSSDEMRGTASATVRIRIHSLVLPTILLNDPLSDSEQALRI